MSLRRRRKGRNILNVKVLADTSAWIEYFNSTSKTGNILESLMSSDSIVTCGIVIFELMQGIKSGKEKSTILNAISELPYIEMNLNLWQKSSALSASLRKNGLILPISDIFIATIAIAHNLRILTLDKHFESIPGLTTYKL